MEESVARINEETRVLRAVGEWLTVLMEVGHRMPTASDVDHSALLQRLLNGKPPLPEPPPRSFSYPWYSLIEDGSGKAEVREISDWLGGDGTILIINQSRWEIVERIGDGYRARWPTTGLICSVHPLSESEADVIFKWKVKIE